MGTRPALAACAALAVLAGICEPAGGQMPEPDIKAHVIERITRYIEWDPGALPSSSLAICVVGPSPLTLPLERVARSLPIKGRKARVSVVNVAAVLGCHIVVIGDRKQLPAVLSRTANQPILTVSDTPGGAAAGAIINLIIVGGTVKFEVNTTSLKGSRFKVRAQLLKLARVVTVGAVPGKAVP